MLSNRIGRLIAFALSIVAALIAFYIFSEIFEFPEGLMVSMLIAALPICLIHLICGDLINFRFTDNIVFRIVKRILFYGVSFGCILISVIYFFEQSYNWGNFLLDLGHCSTLVCGFSACLTCMYAEGADWDEEKLPFLAYFSLIPTIVISIILAILGPSFKTIGGIIVILAGIAGFVIMSRQFGLIYGDGPSYTPKKPKAKPQKTGKMPAALYNKLYAEMCSICSRYEGSKTVGYGVRVKVSAYAILTDDEAKCTVDLDVYLSNCSATADWQVESAAREALAYQKQQMQKIYNALEESVNRLFKQFNYYEETAYSVVPGSSLTHE